MGQAKGNSSRSVRKAKGYEKVFESSGNTFTWSERESLSELERPERIQAIKREHEARIAQKRSRGDNLTLEQVYLQPREDDSDGRQCLICEL